MQFRFWIKCSSINLYMKIPVPNRYSSMWAVSSPVQIDQTCWSNIIQHCWMQHAWPVWTERWNMLPMMLDDVGWGLTWQHDQLCWTWSLFWQHDQTCWMVLDGVGWSFILFKLYIQHCPTFSLAWSKLWVLVPKSNIVGWCWIRFNIPASSTI